MNKKKKKVEKRGKVVHYYYMTFLNLFCLGGGEKSPLTSKDIKWK